eukprot:9049989-Alexandrium_andersonii.AAC.1
MDGRHTGGTDLCSGCRGSRRDSLCSWVAGMLDTRLCAAVARAVGRGLALQLGDRHTGFKDGCSG